MGLYYTFWMRIHVHGVVTQEADERDATPFGKFDREAGWRGNRGDTGNTRQQCLLDDFKRGASTDQQDMLCIRKLTVQQPMPDNFIYRVVASHILAQEQQFAIRAEETGGVQTSSVRKNGLPWTQTRR